MEKGGLNLYGFCRNNSINLWDVLGMEPGEPPSYSGQTVTVLEDMILADGKPGQSYVTYRAVRLADMNNQENGSGDDDLIWIVDLSGNRDSPTRGMSENRISDFSCLGIGVSSSPILTPSRSVVNRTHTITFRVGFDSSITDIESSIAGFNAQVTAMQNLLDTNGLGHIGLTFDLTGVRPTAPSSYDFSTLEPTTLLATQRAQVGALPGVIPILITNQPFIRTGITGGTALGVTLNGGRPSAGVILKNVFLGSDPLTLAHEVGHVFGYVRPGGDSALPSDRHSDDEDNLMFDTTRPNQNVIDAIYRSGISGFAVPKR